MATGKRREKQSETPLQEEKAPKDQPTAPMIEDEEKVPADPTALEEQQDHQDDNEVISPDGEPGSAPKPVPLI
jgi:hypothetical protein